MRYEISLLCNKCQPLYNNPTWGKYPKNLLIYLTRVRQEGDNLIKVMTKVKIPNNLHLNLKRYSLNGIVSHIGKTSMDGHWITYVKHNQNEIWYKCDDSKVQIAEDDSFLTSATCFLLSYTLKT